jgi:hypothetical protein
LDLEAQQLCTTILPWGKYQYKSLPMGVKTSPDIFQRIIYELLGYLPNIQVYLDDILITVLERLKKANFKANLKKMLLWRIQN